MKTNIATFAKKGKLLAVVTLVALVLASIVGTTCHFIAGGFFNYGVENTSKNYIVIEYTLVEWSEDDVLSACETAFSNAGISYETKSASNGEVIYTFSASTDSDKMESASSAIQTALENKADDIQINTSSVYIGDTLTASKGLFINASIAFSIAIVLVAVYMFIRYRLGASITVFVSSFNYILLSVALLAILRIPFGAYAVGVLTVGLILNTICSLVAIANTKSVSNDDKFEEASFEEIAVEGAKKSFKVNHAVAVATIGTSLLIALVLVIFGVYTSFAWALVANVVSIAIVLYNVTYVNLALYNKYGKKIKIAKKVENVAK